MEPINLAEYRKRNRDTVAVVKELLQLAESGQATGIAFVVKLGRNGHHAGIEGDYRRNPEEALPAASRLKAQILLNRMDAQEAEEEVGT